MEVVVSFATIAQSRAPPWLGPTVHVAGLVPNYGARCAPITGCQAENAPPTKTIPITNTTARNKLASRAQRPIPDGLNHPTVRKLFGSCFKEFGLAVTASRASSHHLASSKAAPGNCLLLPHSSHTIEQVFPAISQFDWEGRTFLCTWSCRNSDSWRARTLTKPRFKRFDAAVSNASARFTSARRPAGLQNSPQ